MAREYAQIRLAIWADDDWRDLSPLARYLYLTLLTSPTLSHCGVADWRPSRIAALNGMTADEVNTYGAELVEALYLVIDEASEEVLIRSFIRNDGLMKQPKMAVAMASAHAAIASQGIRGVVVHELKRLREDYPDLNGWGTAKASELLEMRSVDPSTYPLGKGSLKGSGKGKSTPSGKGSPTPAPSPTPATSNLSPSQTTAGAVVESDESDRFDEFWDTYGKKVKRADAQRKWRKALAKPGVTADLIIAAAAEYVAYERAKDGGRFIADASTWLHGERWNDERVDPAAEQPPATRWGTTPSLPPCPAEVSDDPQAYAAWLADWRAGKPVPVADGGTARRAS